MDKLYTAQSSVSSVSATLSWRNLLPSISPLLGLDLPPNPLHGKHSGAAAVAQQ